MNNTELLYATALACAAEDIQERNTEYTVEQIFQHYIVKGQERLLGELEANGRQDN